MKIKLITLIALGLAPAAFPVEYTRFRVCEDQHVIRTSDGAEAGHVEYILVEPTSHRIVSTVVTGGIIGDKYVAVPFESMRFGAEREIVLNEITRERLVSAPVIEKTQITSSTVIQPAVLERTSAHFGVRFDAAARTDVNVREGDRSTATDTTQAERLNEPTKTPPDHSEEAAKAVPGRATTDPSRDRDGTQPNPPEATTREQPRREAEKKPGRAARDPEKASPEKSARTSEQVAPEKSENKSEKAPSERSERPADKSATEKSERASDKSQDKTDREDGKLEEKAERTPPRPEKEKRAAEEPKQL